MKGCYYGGEYEYYDIKDYDVCCTCRNFCDNFLETRFECLKEHNADEDCWEGY